MPPPPPHHPQQQQQPGMKRSRALWDDVRRTCSSRTTSRIEKGRSIIQAICYEVQPVRFKQIDTSGFLQTLHVTIQTCWDCIQSIPALIRSILEFVQTRTKQQKMIVAGIVVYYYFVRWIHHWIEAGPIVLILTTLAAIFTIGLGDDEDINNPDRVSAYSVFNRGFQRIMGTVDAEALLAQHVGGGWMGGIAGGDGGDALLHEAIPAAPQRRAQRHWDNHLNQPHNNNNNNNDVRNDEDDIPNDDENNNDQERRGGRARKSGKKARRRNLEERREARRQREAALALGLQMDNADPEEMVEIQRLIEEQIAAEQLNGNTDMHDLVDDEDDDD